MQVDLHINFPTSQEFVFWPYSLSANQVPWSHIRCKPGFKEDVKIVKFPERWLVKVKVDSGYGKEVKTE